MATIHKRTESARGCGYRKPGGIYLVADGPAASCGKLPAPLDRCPCCGGGIKFSRGFTWISSALFKSLNCRKKYELSLPCSPCPIGYHGAGKMGLMWVGERFYKTPEIFNREADRAGISKRIARVPHDFEVGKTWIALAHIRAIVRPGRSRELNLPETATAETIEEARELDGMGGPVYSPGIFRVFKPSAIEYITTGRETTDELDALEARGFTLIELTRDVDTQKPMFNE